MKSILFLIAFSIVTICIENTVATNVIFCYYGSWAHYKKDEAKVSVEDLSTDKCTHIVYSFVGLTNNGDIKLLDTWLDIDLKALEKLSALKNKNKNLKVMVAIGGWNQGSENFSKVTADKALRSKFVENIVNFVKQWNLDGFDLDWEYPASREGSSPQDKQNFIELIKELHNEFKKIQLILTAAVGATKSHRENSYHVKSMTEYLDYINVMSYDLHDYSEGKTGFNAPLYASASEAAQGLDVYKILKGWIADGSKPEKLLMGLGFYGKSYTLADANNHDVGAPTSGAGNIGEFTGQSGVLSYLEICKKIKNEGWKNEWDDEHKVPFAYKDNQWVGYDDAKSLELKVNAAKELKLAGVLIWSTEQDDVRNTCGGGDYTLLNAVHKSMKTDAVKDDVSVTTKRSLKPRQRKRLSTIKTPVQYEKKTSTPNQYEEKTTTLAPIYGKENPTTIGVYPKAAGDCNGVQPDPSDCKHYLLCGSGLKYRMECPPGTLFDKINLVCNHTESVICY